jgi:penicillin-binding protein 1A
LTFVRTILWSLLGVLLLTACAIGGLLAILIPDLPAVSEVRDIRLKEPLRVYTIDGRLMAEYGNERRITINIGQAPPLLIDAILAAEDDRFFRHHGVDFTGVLRAVVANLHSGDASQGASTITMQVARNYFLSREKTYTRKIKEVLLAFRMEHELDKEEILELYLNKIFLGHRAYGFQAAASIYYDKELQELSLAQLAMLAGLPKTPSRNNPLANPEAAVTRRNYVLRRMRHLEIIDQAKYASASAAPVTAAHHIAKIEIQAPYVSEMVRDYMVRHYGEDAYRAGFRVFTTINPQYQTTANAALGRGLMAYDRRHSYRGTAGHIDLEMLTSVDERAAQLAGFDHPWQLEPALVLATGAASLEVWTGDGHYIEIGEQGWRWTGRTPSQLFNPGDVVYVLRHSDGTRLAQIPQIQGALVSLNPVDGSLLALVGGFDFQASKFNRATQAERQPGSNIKPFIYSAALDNGFTAATLVSGAPIVVENNLGDAWRPENYSRKVFGPTRLRKALSLSLNLVSVRITRAMGIPLVTDHLEQFGFDRSRLPQGLSLALGSATVTPMEIARGYAAFANGGYLVEPYFIARVEGQAGGVMEYANRTMVCPDCTPVAGPAQNSTTSRAVDPRFARRVLAPENAFIMTSLLGEVIRTGTGRAAQKLERHDLAGKTGTTNNFHDAWFTGYNPDVVTSVWVGFDNPRDLGTRESGARAALPVWIDYMAVALADKPEARRVMPENIITAFINGDSGEPTATDDPDGFEEYFVMGTEPQAQSPFGEEAAGRRQGAQQVEGLF